MLLSIMKYVGVQTLTKQVVVGLSFILECEATIGHVVKVL